jgi:predicted O-methyltransferase YrrM
MPDVHAQEILGTARSFWRARLLLTLAELDLFSRTAERPRSLSELVEETGANARGMQILLDAAVGQDWLEKVGEAYRCPAERSRYLASDGADSVLPMLHHMGKLWHRWTDLSGIVAPHTEPAWAGDEGHTASFIGAMHVVGRDRAEELVRAVEPRGESRLLDVGGASGTYTMAFLNAHPEMRATLFDLPEVVALAEERLESEGLRDRVRLAGGDFYTDELPDGPHDLALLSAIIHQNDPDQNVALYRKIHDVLAPGGRLIVRDHVLDEDRTTPPDASLFAVNMLVATEGGNCYTLDEIREGLESAGFRDVRLLQRDERMSGLVEARKG